MSTVIIDSKIKFTIQTGELSTNGETEKKIQLLQPDSNCLALLVKRKGVIVSQDELITAAWGESRSKSVTTNAYYQSILRIRKAFLSIDDSAGDIIETIPRRGLIIRKDISEIYECTGDSRPSIKVQKKMPISVLTSSFVLTALVIFTALNIYKNDSVFHEYSKEFSINKCEVFSTKKTPDNIRSFLQKQLTSRCERESHLYLPAVTGNDWISFFTCPTKNTEKEACFSELYIGAI